MRTASRLYTVDASVFLNAFNQFEQGHQESRNLLARFRSEATPVVVPALLLTEIAGAIARGRDDARLAREFATAVSRLAHLVLIPLDLAVARAALDIAAQYRLRGADSTYAAVALRFGSTLVTRDREQRERVAPVLPTCTPAEALDL